MIKAIAKFLLIFLACIALAYFALVYMEGGFGMKSPKILPKMDGSSQLLFAHRGVVTDYPENSLEAIRDAKAKGFQAVEIDIRRTSDGEFILFHDATTERLLGIEGRIAEMSMAQIRKYKLLKNGDTSSCDVASLKEMLTEHKNDLIFYFDLKLGCLNDADELVSLVMNEDIHESVIIASPSFLISLYIKFHYPSIYTAMEGFDAGKEWVYRLIPGDLRPDFLSGFSSKVNNNHVKWLNEKGLLSNRIVYGVDSADYHDMVNLGIKNMIIDYFSTLEPNGI